jgi:hypothetical protein
MLSNLTPRLNYEGFVFRDETLGGLSIGEYLKHESPSPPSHGSATTSKSYLVSQARKPT